MRIEGYRFLSGPSIHGDDSGLLISTDLQTLARPAALAVVPEAAARVFAVLGLPELGRLWAAAERPAAPAMLCSLAAALLRPASVFPPAARVLAVGPPLVSFLGCDDPVTGQAAWDCAGKALLAAAGDDAALEAFAAAHRAFGAAVGTWRVDALSAALARAARRLGVPWYRLRVPGRLVQVGQGIHGRLLLQTMSDSTGAVAREAAADRFLANRLLAAAGVPVVPMSEATTEAAAVAAAERIGYPVVVRPGRGTAGGGAAVGLAGPEAVTAAFRRAVAGGRSVLVEGLARGAGYRALVIGGRLVAAARRLPAPARPGDAVPEPDGPPEPGRVPPQRAAGLPGGGTALDATAAVHPENRAMLERAAAALRLGIAGIDLVIPDIARSWRETGAAVLGCDAVPGLRPHWLGAPGVDLAEPILRAHLPAGSDGRIPTCGITGTHGKTTTANMVARILEGLGLTVGRCTSVGVTVGAERRRSGDCAGGGHARELLLDPMLQAGVFELARGGLLNDGMVIEDCEVGAVLNVLDNHIGTDGIASRADLARIKSVVARRARRALVLNAEDPLCLAMRDGARAERLWLVARDPAAPALAAHRAAGGAAAFLEDGVLRLAAAGGAGEAVLPVAAIPATLGGHHAGKQWNALFAAAIAHAMGAPLERIGAGLAAFRPDLADSQGRCSLIERHGVRVLLDYGTGGDAIGLLAAAVRAMPVAGRRLAYVMAAGRSEDALIRATGRALAGGFDLYVCTDWAKRPRPDREAVPRLLAEGLLAGGVPAGRILCRPGEDDALRLVLGRARPGDLVVVVTGEVERAAAIVEGFVPAAPAEAAAGVGQALS